MKSAFQLPHIPLTRPIILLRELRFYSSRQAEMKPNSAMPFTTCGKACENCSGNQSFAELS